MLQRLIVNEVEKCECKVKEALRELRDRVGLIPHSIEIELFWNVQEHRKINSVRGNGDPFEDIARVHISLKRENKSRFANEEK